MYTLRYLRAILRRLGMITYLNKLIPNMFDLTDQESSYKRSCILVEFRGRRTTSNNEKNINRPTYSQILSCEQRHNTIR